MSVDSIFKSLKVIWDFDGVFTDNLPLTNGIESVKFSALMVLVYLSCVI